MFKGIMYWCVSVLFVILLCPPVTNAENIYGKPLPVGTIITPEQSTLLTDNVALLTVPETTLEWEANIGTPMGMSDDGCISKPIGFTFNFYGVAYTQLWVNSNGNVTFDECNTCWSHGVVPDLNHIIISPLYGDFSPNVSGDVYFNVLGTEPDRRLVVTWQGVPEYRPTNTGHSTFQLQLFEGSNNIMFGYNGLGTDGINWAYSFPATNPNMNVGISSGTGDYICSATGATIPSLDGKNICYTHLSSGDYIENIGACFKEIEIDIMPGDFPNNINLSSSGVIPVAILSTNTFDATTIDPATVTLAGAAVKVVGKSDRYLYSLEDVNGDDRLDFKTKIYTAQIFIEAGAGEAVLEALTFDGIPLWGKDTVQIVSD